MTPSEPRTWWTRAATVALPVYWVLLALATHYPQIEIPTRISYRDKIVHFAAFGLLAVLAWQFARARWRLDRGFAPRAGALLIAYAAVDEYTQQFFHRHTDPLDLAANTAGIVVALVMLERRRRRSARAPASRAGG